MYIRGKSFDDILREALLQIFEKGDIIKPKKGDALEIIGAHLILENPRLRLSRSELRSTLLSALGETLWYLSGSDDFEHISYYIKNYRELCGAPATDKISQAAYGPRIVKQIEDVINVVQRDSTRRGVIAIFSEKDKDNAYEEPCTCFLHLLPRNGKLHMSCHMRSSDAFVGFAHDVFAFTFMQEYIACRANLKLGEYHHHASSFHLYNKDMLKARKYLKEGVFEHIPMPSMPIEGANNKLIELIEIERRLRLNLGVELESLSSDFWGDLGRLLLIKKLGERDVDALAAIRTSMDARCFDTYLHDVEGRLSKRKRSNVTP